MAYVITAVLLALFVAVILYYNKFIALKNMLKEAVSGIDVQLKRRHDLVPNLIMTVILAPVSAVFWLWRRTTRN